MSVLDSGMNSVDPLPGCGRIHGNVRIPILIYALCFFLSTPARSEPFPTDAQANRSPADAIVGLWGTEQTMGPMVRGELTIDGRAPEWRARIAGFETRVERKHEGIRFELPGAGEFRGHMERGGKRISGHWIETAGIAFYSYQYASPIELSEVSPNVWRGVVVPLEERVSFYVSVERSPNGSLTAFVRNPEGNRFRGHGFDVELKDGSVIFSYQGKTQLLDLRSTGRRAIAAPGGFLPASPINPPPPRKCARLLSADSTGELCLSTAGCRKRRLGCRLIV